MNFRVTNEFNAPFNYFSLIELTEGRVKGQYARDQVFCMKTAASSGTQTQHR